MSSLVAIGRYASKPVFFVGTTYDHTEFLIYYGVYVFENWHFFGLQLSQYFLLVALELFKCSRNDIHEMLEGTKLTFC